MQKNPVTELKRFRLDGNLALVTGALGNLGSVWIRGLLEAGAEVVGVDVERAKISDSFQELLDKYSGKLSLLRIDVTNRNSVVKGFKESKKIGFTSIIVNNAGIDQPPTAPKKGYLLEEIPIEAGQKIFDVNVLGAFLVMQIFGSEMVKKNQGTIINIASHYGLVSPDPGFYTHIKTDPPFLKPPMYGSSKAALIQLTRYMAVLWGKNNVRVNSISPGGVFNNQDVRFVKKYSLRVPLGRMAKADELIGPLVFLASDAASYVTGANIVVDGGFTAL